jgi:hypothetical protein
MAFVEQLSSEILIKIRTEGINTKKFFDYLQPHFSNYTEHFIHEFIGFASSHWNTVENYDHHAIYRPRNSQNPFNSGKYGFSLPNWYKYRAQLCTS